MIALSIRQPWAWLIVNGWKDIENRTWATSYRGDFIVHAGKGMTRDEYDEAREITGQILGDLAGFPDFDALPRGGIVGVTKIIDCVSESRSPWFVGPRGFVLSGAIEIPFAPYKGQLGFFEYKFSSLCSGGEAAPEVADLISKAIQRRGAS